MRWRRGHRIAGLGAALALAGCPWLQSASERAECDRALEVVCGCSTGPCREPDAAPAVETLRRCDTAELTAGGMHLATCINEQPRYCEVLDGLRSGSAELCGRPCAASCDLRSDCERFQYLHCGVGDGGQP